MNVIPVPLYWKKCEEQTVDYRRDTVPFITLKLSASCKSCFAALIHSRQPHMLRINLVQEPVLINSNQLYSSNWQQKHSTCGLCYNPTSSYLFPMTEVIEKCVIPPGPRLVSSLLITIAYTLIPAHHQEMNEQPHGKCVHAEHAMSVHTNKSEMVTGLGPICCKCLLSWLS